MRYRGPVITLLAVAALAAVLFVVNMRTVAETAARGSAPPATAPPAAQVPVVTAPPDSPPAPPPPAGQPAPPPPAAPPQANYAGRTSGNEATIAIAVEGDAASAYVCDGKQIESWLDGTIENGRLTLQGGDGDQVTGSVQDGAVFGTMWVQGKQWPYSAQPAQAPAGLYDGQGTVDGAPARVGWIVLQDGSQVGVADIGGVRQPAPAIDPQQLRSVELGGSVIVPQPVGGHDDVVQPPS
ncbi:MAG: hypothetical protein ACRDTE_04000 [Pseudonocardiaceae bacterium]